MMSRCHMSAILIFTIAWYCCNACEVDDVAVYKVKLHTMWDKDMLPKEYPGKQQWSQVFGQSHNRSYALYSIGEVSKRSVHEFLQFGTPDPLMEEGEEDPKVYDQFQAPAIQNGEGKTESIVFVDEGHSLVSMISKMLPSENWFIGVDSVDLCLHSSWVDQVTLDLVPLDAGSNDNTNERPDSVRKIPINYDFFTGSGIHNRHSRRIHSIAKVDFIKIKEYSTKELNDLARKDLIAKVKSKKHQNDVPKIIQSGKYKQEEFTTKNSIEQLKDLEEDPVGTPKPHDPENNVVVVTNAPAFGDSEETHSLDLGNMDEVVLAVANGKKLGLGKHLPRHFRSRLHQAVNRSRGRDCIVSGWSEWTLCSDPCGEKSRIRTVVQKKKGNGKDCPILIQKQTCGRCVRGDGDYMW